MVNPWRKYRLASKRKRQALHSLIVGFVLFGVLYAVTKALSIPLCLFQNLFHTACPGCGLTRGFIAILRLDFQGAMRYHVLSIPLFVGILAYSILCFSDILFERNDLDRLGRRLGSKYGIALLICLWIAFLVLQKRI